jgi:hypothetical protein
MSMVFLRLVIAAAACGCVTACGATASLLGPTAPAARGACEGSSSGAGFAVSLAIDSGGEPTAVEAARKFIRTGGIWTSPQDGWRVESEDDNGATLVAEASSLHAIRLKDATWAVDSGRRCGG